MSSKSDNSELLISDTLVPDIFIIQHIHDLSKNAICLYMWLLMIMGNTSFTMQNIAEYSVISDSEKTEAIAELISNDLVLKKGEKSFYLADLKKREVEEYCKTMIAKGDSLDGIELSKDKSRDVLASSISKTFYLGKMANINYRLIDKCLYEYKFDSSVVYSLFEEARNRKCHFKISYLNKLAEDWYKKGYTTPDKLQKMYDSKNEIDAIVKLLGKLTRKRLDGLDMEKIEKWVYEYEMNSQMVDFAYRSNAFRDKISIKNVDDTLTLWFLADAKTVDQASIFENKKHEENKAKATRKKSSGNAWKTGSEMGVVSDVKADKAEKPQDEDSDSDEILDLFGRD